MSNTNLANDNSVYVPNLKHGIGFNTITSTILVRSSIFSSLQYRGPCCRPQYNNQALISPKSASIVQLEGSQLDQADASLWYQLIRVALLSNSGQLVKHAAVKAPITLLFTELETTAGGKTRKLLEKSLHRLQTAEFRISVNNEYSYIFQPISEFYVSEQPKKTLLAILGEGSVDVFKNHQLVILKKAELNALKSDLLAQGLYAYFASHSQPHPIKSSTLKKLLVHESMQESKWLFKLKESLELMKEATKWHKCSLDEGNKVVVERTANISKAQAPKRQTNNDDLDDFDEDNDFIKFNPYDI
ncbi:hypothetical protein ACBP93_00960 [Paenalcaligenes hominis]|uniref:hypothetical protein n=1 Tax=Paenalcaligenes hominis TaxID=643674 RepID=UPI003524117C